MKTQVFGCDRSVKVSNGWVHRLWEETGWVNLVSLSLLLCVTVSFILFCLFCLLHHERTPRSAICEGQTPTRHLLATWPWISQPSKCSEINFHSLQITQTHSYILLQKQKTKTYCLSAFMVWECFRRQGMKFGGCEVWTWTSCILAFIIYKRRKYLNICLVKCLWYFEVSLEKCQCWLQYLDRAFLKLDTKVCTFLSLYFILPWN